MSTTSSLTDAELVNLTPAQLEQDYYDGLISPADLVELVNKAAFYDLAELVGAALPLADFEPSLFLNTYQQALFWLQRGSAELYQAVTKYYYTLSSQRQADLRTEMTRRGLLVPEVALSTYQPDLVCNMTYENIQPGQGYTQCNFKQPHSFSLESDQAYFTGAKARQCPFCFQPVSRNVYYQGLPGASGAVSAAMPNGPPTSPVLGRDGLVLEIPMVPLGKYKRPGSRPSTRRSST